MPSLTRRDLLKAGSGGAAFLSLARGARLARTFAEEGKRIPVGLQLYSVQEEAADDLVGTLAAIAGMGYRGVEFAGYYGRSAAELRTMLADAGLACCGSHVGIDAVLGDALKETIEFNQALGNKYLIVASLGEEYTGSRAGWERAARALTEAAVRARPAGMLVGFHNCTQSDTADFHPFDDGTLPWDLVFSSTPDDFVQQIDTGSVVEGGADPVALIRRYPGRTRTIHLKEHGGPFGEGEVPWEAVFEACETVGGTEWYIVEQYRHEKPPLESVAYCLEVLRKWGKV